MKACTSVLTTSGVSKIRTKRERHRLERRWLSSRNESDRQRYRHACHSANKEINDSRKNHFRRKLEDCRDDPRRCWNVVKEILPSSTSDTSRTDAENRELCHSFSHFFSSKMLNLKLFISSQLSPLSPSVALPDPQLASSTLYSIPPVTPSEVFKILKTSPLKSSTLDFIPSALLKSHVLLSFLILSPTLPTCHSIRVIFLLFSSPPQSLLSSRSQETTALPL